MGTFDYTFATPLSLGKMQGRAVQQKIGERCRGATPLSLGKMQGQGSAAKNWRVLPLGGGYPAIFGKNAGARQCSKKLASATAKGLPLIFGKNAGARQCSKNWRALPLGGYPSIFGKNCRGRAVQ